MIVSKRLGHYRVHAVSGSVSYTTVEANENVLERIEDLLNEEFSNGYKLAKIVCTGNSDLIVVTEYYDDTDQLRSEVNPLYSL